MQRGNKREHPTLALAVLLVAATVAPARGAAPAALLNVQILGRGGDPKGGPDPEPPAYQGAGMIGAERDYWNGIRADSGGQPLRIIVPGPLRTSDSRTPTGVTLAFAGFVGADHWPLAQGAPVQNSLLNSYLVCRSQASVAIDGLIPPCILRPLAVWQQLTRRRRCQVQRQRHVADHSGQHGPSAHAGRRLCRVQGRRGG